MSKDREVVGKRYAVALFELAKDHQKIDSIEQELLVVKDILSGDNDLEMFLHHPKVATEKKKAFIQEVFSSQLSDVVLNTLLLLIDRKREGMIPSMVEQYISLANQERGIADAVVYSVNPLSEEEKTALTETFAKRLDKKTLRIDNKIDSELIGGIKLVVENRVFDGSVLNKLNRIKKQLVSAGN